MKLYISNPTSQHQIFNYRDPATGLLGHVRIQRGGQEVIDRPKWNGEHLEKMLEQLHHYGARDAAEAYRKMGGFRQALLYRVDGVISEDEILMGNEQDEDARQERSVQEVVKAAATFDGVARRGGKNRDRANVTETSVRTERARGAKPQPGDVDFSLTVDPASGRDHLDLASS